MVATNVCPKIFRRDEEMPYPMHMKSQKEETEQENDWGPCRCNIPGGRCNEVFNVGNGNRGPRSVPLVQLQREEMCRANRRFRC